MPFIKRLFGHFKTITKHRILVRHLCFKVGLYKQGMLHDLSKYSPVEFWSGVKYFEGFRSPIAKERELNGFSYAWFHHTHRNKHHFEFWIEKNRENKTYYSMEMPFNYLLESVMDRIAACKVYRKDAYDDASAYDFLEHGSDQYYMSPIDKDRLYILLAYLKDNGEEKALAYYKDLYKTWKSTKQINL